MLLFHECGGSELIYEISEPPRPLFLLHFSVLTFVFLGLRKKKDKNYYYIIIKIIKSSTTFLYEYSLMKTAFE